MGVRERDREQDPGCPRRLWSGEECTRRFDGDSEILAARSVLVLAVLPDPRRLRNENGNCKDEGPPDGPSPVVCCCVTSDESKLYAGVEGSDGLSINTGNDAEA